jgi:glycosyltransferase involved in cell wall biosynthesis
MSRFFELKKTESYPRKVFLGPVEIAGFYAQLKAGFQAIGVPCELVIYEPHNYLYPTESKHPLSLHFLLTFHRFRRKTRSVGLTKWLLIKIEQTLEFIWVIEAIARYDVFIFGFGQTLVTSSRDLLILNMFRKRIISILGHGSESRPPYMDNLESITYPLNLERLNERTKMTWERIRIHEKYADSIICSPYTSQFFSRKLINFLQLGIPMAKVVEPIGRFETEGKHNRIFDTDHTREHVRILHAPSNRKIKGTKLIQAAIVELINEGFAIDFKILENKPNSWVRQAISECDFVVDQLHSDTPMATLACEAAIAGIPVVVSGYGLPELEQRFRSTIYPPTLTCTPNDLKKVIRQLVMSKKKRLQLGREAKNFVLSNWSPSMVAARYYKIILGDLTTDFYFDPLDFCYTAGGGVSEDEVVTCTSALIEKFGPSALCLDHRPDMKRAILNRIRDRKLSKRQPGILGEDDC